ncbi:MAG: hypothetical protein K6G24_12685, partial [Lachnospiraceae bacterium]|nr:hypothetical protein [Lachnospiraceae bacterium]
TEGYMIQIGELDFTVEKRGDKNFKRFFSRLDLALRFIRSDLIKRDLRNEAETLDDVIKIITRERKEFEEYVKTALANMNKTSAAEKAEKE